MEDWHCRARPQLFQLLDRGGPLANRTPRGRSFSLFRSCLYRRQFRRTVVVLPEPCKPQSMMTEIFPFRSRGASSLPISAINSSWTSLMNCWPGVTDLMTESPIAFSFTRFTNRSPLHNSRRPRAKRAALGEPHRRCCPQSASSSPRGQRRVFGIYLLMRQTYIRK